MGGLESRSTPMSPEASLRAWMPAIHAGMTNSGFSFFVCERKLMNYFVVNMIFAYLLRNLASVQSLRKLRKL
jgi:hypothetical protein